MDSNIFRTEIAARGPGWDGMADNAGVAALR